MKTWKIWLTGFGMLAAQAVSAMVVPSPPVDSPAQVSIHSAGHQVHFFQQGLRVEGAASALTVGFVDAKPEAKPTAGEQQVYYAELWDGISLTYDTGEGILRSTYRLKPGVDPAAILLDYNAPIQISASGSLLVPLNGGQFTETPPIAWQEINGNRVPVTVAFAKRGESQLGFELGEYRREYGLIIDPVLKWTRVFGDGPSGGTTRQEMVAITSDDAGNTFVTGYTDAAWTTATTPLSPYDASREVYVAKLDATGSPLWETFLGGAMDETPGAILVHGTDLYIVGTTSSQSWSDGWGTTGGSVPNANGDLFLAQLTTDGTPISLVFFGGPDQEVANGIALATENGTDYLYLVGDSYGGNWTSPGQINPADKSGNSEIFIAKLTTGGNMLWHTFHGGESSDLGNHLVIDSALGRIYVAGHSNDTWGSPVRPFSGAGSGLSDLLLIALDTDGNYLRHTFLGGSATERGTSYSSLVLKKDSGGDRLYISGTSDSINWGQATGAPVRPHQGGWDMVVASVAASDFAFSPTNNSGWYAFYGSSATDEAGSLLAIGDTYLFLAGYAANAWPDEAVQVYSGSGIDGVVGMIKGATGELLSHSFVGTSAAKELLGDMTFTDYGVAVAGSYVTTTGVGLDRKDQYDGYAAGLALQGQIALLEGGLRIAEDGIVDFGTVEAEGTLAKRFTVRNTGTAPLKIMEHNTVAGVYAIWQNAVMKVTEQPVFPITDVDNNGVLAPGEEQTFLVQFAPGVGGVYEYSVRLLHDGPNTDGEFHVYLKGTAAGTPVLELLGIDSNVILSGTTTTSTAAGTSFATIAAGVPGDTHTFTLKNPGTQDLTFSGAAVVISDDSGLGNFTLTAAQPSVLAAKSSLNLPIQFTPKAVGNLRAKVTISSNELAPYTAYVAGTATGPIIGVSGNNADIINGATSATLANHTDFDTLEINTERVRTFTITNFGSAGTVLNLTPQGGAYVLVNGEGFSLKTDVPPVGAALDPNESTTFQVAFNPTSAANYAGSVTILSDDQSTIGEGFSFAISGEGVGQPAVTLSATDVTTSERDADTPSSVPVQVSLSTKPTASVTVTFTYAASSAGNGEFVASRDEIDWSKDQVALVFTTTDTYPSSKTIYFRGVDDNVLDLDTTLSVSSTVTSSDAGYNNLPLADIRVNNRNRHYSTSCSGLTNIAGLSVNVNETKVCRLDTGTMTITDASVFSGGTAAFYAPQVVTTGSSFKAGSKVHFSTNVNALDISIAD